MSCAMKLIFWKLHRLLFCRKSAWCWLEPKTKLNVDDCLVIVSILGQILLHGQPPSLSWLHALFERLCCCQSVYQTRYAAGLASASVLSIHCFEYAKLKQPAKTRKMIKFRYFLCFIHLVSLSPLNSGIYLSIYVSISVFVICFAIWKMLSTKHKQQPNIPSKHPTIRGYKNKTACSTFIVSYFHCEIIRFIGFYNVYIVHYNSFSFVHCVLEVFYLSLSIHISKRLWLIHQQPGASWKNEKEILTNK